MAHSGTQANTLKIQIPGRTDWLPIRKATSGAPRIPPLWIRLVVIEAVAVINMQQKMERANIVRLILTSPFDRSWRPTPASSCGARSAFNPDGKVI